jgi:hypothetical protein
MDPPPPHPAAEESSSSHLPNDLIEDILARMPAKSAERCRSLSRAWAAALSSRSFVDRHLTASFLSFNASHSPPLLRSNWNVSVFVLQYGNFGIHIFRNMQFLYCL